MAQDPPLVGDRHFRDDVVRLAALTVNTSRLEGYGFSNCRIIGPAILGILNNVTIAGSRFDAPGLDAIFWEIPPGRGPVVGIIAVADCTFSNCTFENIGVAGPPELREALADGFS